jgi:hypothetical protein
VTITIEFSLDASAMLDEADERWIAEHGFGDDNPLLAEVTRATEMLRDTPELGLVYRRMKFRRDVRRLLLRSGWHLYYTFDGSAVVVIAVWFATRGSDPPI